MNGRDIPQTRKTITVLFTVFYENNIESHESFVFFISAKNKDINDYFNLLLFHQNCEVSIWYEVLIHKKMFKNESILFFIISNYSHIWQRWVISNRVFRCSIPYNAYKHNCSLNEAEGENHQLRTAASHFLKLSSTKWENFISRSNGSSRVAENTTLST